MNRSAWLIPLLAPSLLWADLTLGIPEPPAFTPIRTIQLKEDAAHNVGRAGSRGWQVDYRSDRPGYAMAGLYEPLVLEPGYYRATFTLRRGHYPNKGLLFKTYGLFRLEVWDTTANELVKQRELQIGDFNSPNSYEPRWLEFSMKGREGHVLEPRVYWIGLANGEVASVQIDRYSDPNLRELERKAQRLGEILEKDHLENGFVVSRKLDGEADETGDSTTYTGFYVASLAWKYAVTHDAHTYQALENGLATLHKAIIGTPEEPLIARFVDANGNSFPKGASKDVFTAFFLAYAAAYPHITNEALRAQMREDVENITRKFLKDGLRIKAGSQTLTSLTPYFTDEEVASGIQDLFRDKKKLRKITKALRSSRHYIPFGELWPGMKQVIKAMEAQNEQQLMALVPSTLDGATRLVERVRDILREQYREDLFPRRYTNREYPGIKLADMLTDFLKKFPKDPDGKRIRRLSDMRILASNAAISLHVVKTASVISGESTFTEYYRTNLHTQDALLKTALDWYGIEDKLTQLTAGNATADRERRGYLGNLSLLNLATLEKNPAIKEKYQSLIRREWELYQHDDNPLMAAIYTSVYPEDRGNVDAILHQLDVYPEQRMGFGPDYWKEFGKDLAEKFGGGEEQGFSREPMPVSHRPKDSFLWQRNARRLKGDWIKTYPATDYLFVYWFGRAKGIIPAPTRSSLLAEQP